jgi:hypothetical protein
LSADIFIEIQGERRTAVDSLEGAILALQMDADISIDVGPLENRAFDIRPELVAQPSEGLIA